MNVTGQLITFGYLAETTTKFDVFPLIICLKVSTKSIFGINIHYWNQGTRIEFLSKLDKLGYDLDSIIKVLSEINNTRRIISQNFKSYKFENIKTEIKTYDHVGFVSMMRGYLPEFDSETSEMFTVNNKTYVKTKGI